MKKVKVIVGEDGTGADTHLAPGKNLFTGQKKFEEEFGQATSLEVDLLNIASGVFAADLAVRRDEREHYIRNIELTVQVANFYLLAPLKQDFERALHVVSRDNWTIKFKRSRTHVEDLQDISSLEGAVLLFSGGIDSMCAASELIAGSENLVLVSHSSLANNAVDAAQKAVHELLEKHYKVAVRHLSIRVYGRDKEDFPFPKDDERENTQRTRSFMFLTLAALVSRRLGFYKVLYMAENGQFAIHLPLNAARVGPFSTHTADPEFVALVQNIFRTIFEKESFEIQNPFLYKTKGEVFGVLPKALQSKADLSVSCWMISRLRKHCGYCIPCISRRIAIESNGISFDEYKVDLFRTGIGTFADDDDRKRNLTDFLEFVIRFASASPHNLSTLKIDFPELYNPAFDFDKTVDLYRRVAAQALTVFEGYPEIRKLL